MRKKTILIDIDGMSCGHCIKTVRLALENLEGVEVRSVEIGRAVVDVDVDLIATDRVKEAIDETGFEVRAVA